MTAIKIEVDTENTAFDLNVARDRFESALHELRNKDETSSSENESDTEAKAKPLHHTSAKMTVSKDASQLPSRPARKRRRKDVDIRESGFHQTYIMRMFDRSVDLAQFEESSPLYPICRAWMLNYPTNDQNVKTEPSSPLDNGADELLDKGSNERVSPIALITDLPSPDRWPTVSRKDCRIPSPIPHPTEKLTVVNGMEDTSQASLLLDHVKRWREIRNKWKEVAFEGDARYSKTYYLFKSMFDR